MVSTCWEGLRPSRPPRARFWGGATASQTPGGGKLLLPPRIEVEQDDSNTQHFYNQANRFLDTFARHRSMSAAIYALWSRVGFHVVWCYPLATMGRRKVAHPRRLQEVHWA